MLTSGHHENIARWQKKEALRRTLERRSDLLVSYTPTKQEQKLLDELFAENPALAERYPK